MRVAAHRGARAAQGRHGRKTTRMLTDEEKTQLESERSDLATLIHQTTGRRLD